MAPAWKVRRGGGTPLRSRDDLQAVLLKQRGVPLGRREAFFEPSYERDVLDPASLAGTAEAVDRLARAAKRRERVLVYGDYDADGISGTAILVTTLRDLGLRVMPYLPHRLEDGYGLSKQALERLIDEFDILVSVDCGISNAAEVAELNRRGKEVIIVDHHLLPAELPPARAILHPALANYGCPHLSGAGVAWKLAQALLRDSRLAGDVDPDREKWLLDLACIGTVADMVPLTGENRAIVSFGCEVLRRSRRPGVRLLVEAACRQGEEVSAELISFRIAPLLNAAGRMDHAQPAFDLLLAPSEERARLLMAQLRRYNDARRRHSQLIYAEAEQAALADAPIIFAYNERWPAGVVGLVAGKLADKFSRPSVVVGNGGLHAVGSVRAPAGFHAVDLMASAQDYLLKLGGHAAAAGFTVAHNQIDRLREALLANNRGPVMAGGPVHEADAVVDVRLLDWDTLALLERFQPYGEGNKRPRLVACDVALVEWRPVGKTGDHAKMLFEIDGEFTDGIGFGLAQEPDLVSLRGGGQVDTLFHLDRNEYQGRRTLQLNVVAAAPTGSVTIAEQA